MRTRLVLATAVAFLAGCLPYTQRTITTVDQTAYVPPPSGLLVEGALTNERRAGVQGSLEYAFTQKSGTRESGASGHAVLDRGLSLTAMLGAKDFLELGLGGDLRNEQLSTTTSSDGSLDDGSQDRTSVWVEPYMRFDLNPGKPDAIDVILFASVDGGEVRYVRRVTEQTTRQYYDPIDRTPVDSAESYSVEVDADKALILRPRAGFNFVIPLGSAVGVSLAGLVQSQPNFFGQTKVMERCESSGIGQTCTGKDASDVDAYDSDVMLTVGTGVALKANPAVIIAKGWFNVAGAREWLDDSPGGVSIDLRFNL